MYQMGDVIFPEFKNRRENHRPGRSESLMVEVKQ